MSINQEVVINFYREIKKKQEKLKKKKCKGIPCKLILKH